MSGVLGLMLGGGGTVDITGGSASRTSTTSATASYTLGSDGIETVQGLGATTHTWLVGGSASSYEVRATLNSGSVTSGTTGSWLAIPQTWACIRSTIGVNTASLTIEVRHKVSLTVLDSASVTLYAEVTP